MQSTASTSIASDSSRFAETAQEHGLCLTDRRTPSDAEVGEILVATKNELPYVASDTLKYDSDLGRGTSFRVSREVYHKRDATPYFVAVKRFHVALHDGRPNRIRYKEFIRELRVLMHLPLRTHGCIVQTVAYGWTEDVYHGLQPYLIMEYSDHGTLVNYLTRCKISLDERRELALDVASALKSLHDCKIVHGDVKPQNVLVYDNHDNEGLESIRPQVARLADFGGAIFEHDFGFASYTGTPIYLAPFAPQSLEESSSEAWLLICMAADSYSFGLLLWEIVLNGQSYFDGICTPGESLEKCLERIRSTGKDALCDLSLVSCGGAMDMGGRPSVSDTIRNTLRLCLKDDPSDIGSMGDILSTLVAGTALQRRRLNNFRGLVNPRGTTMVEPTSPSPTTQATIETTTKAPDTFYKLMAVTSKDFIVRPATGDNLRLVMNSAPTDFIEKEVVDDYEHKPFDVFKAVMTIWPPWKTLCELASQMLRSTSGRHSARNADAHLQSAVMYYLGYGVEPDVASALHHLNEWQSQMPDANEFYLPVSRALQQLRDSGAPQDQPGEVDRSKTRCESYLPMKPLLPEKSLHHRSHSAGTMASLSNLTLDESWNAGAGSVAELLIAFQSGELNAEHVAQNCTKSMYDTTKPNVLHWLVNLDASRAAELLDLLIPELNHGNPNSFLLGQSSGSPLYFPSLRMELFGTPLHWAVRTGNVELVSLLLEHGANVNARWQSPTPKSAEPFLGRYQPCFSPLDIAVVYHFAEITRHLLDHGAEVNSDDREWGYTCFHMISQPTLPFSRFLAHGEHHRSACRETITVLQNFGVDINSLDSNMDTPLTTSIRDSNIESYILEELISAGGVSTSSFDAKHGSIIIKAARFCPERPLCDGQASLLAPLVDNLNKLDGDGRNALHYCAINDAANMARALHNTGRVMLDQRATDGHTALTYAAIYGSIRMIEFLVESRFNINLPSTDGASALELAVIQRHIQASVTLIRAGAKLSLEKRNVLHLAVTNASQRGSIASDLLDQCPQELQVSSILDEFNAAGWTPLHCAAYFGDVGGVEALLNAGANPLRQKYPGYISMGGNALELVAKTIEKIRVRGLGIDHKVIEKRGHEAISAFSKQLDQIQSILEERTHQ